MAFVYWIHLPEHTDMFSTGYIGFTSKTVESRYKEHLKKARTKSPYAISRAIRKYGDDLVVTTVLEGSSDYCLDIEGKLRPKEAIGWNMCCGGSAPMLNMKHTEDSKKKQSKVQLDKNFHHSEETKTTMNSAKKGVPRSDETKAKISLLHKGKVLTDEHKQKLSESGKGRVVTDETREKLSQLFKGRPFTQEARDASLAYSKSLKPWENPAAKLSRGAWLMAHTIYDYMQKFVDHGSRKVCNHFMLPLGHVERIHKNIRNGWNPSEDESWLEFKEEYNNKEAQAHAA